MESNQHYQNLSKRERQIIDIIHKMSEASVMDVLDRLPDPPTYNSIRAIIMIMVKKGYLRHRKEGKKYLYQPVAKEETVKQGALGHLLTTFFDGSAPKAISSILNITSSKLSKEDFQELKQMIEDAEKKTK
ncbi:BlaI/MecI/CopY family transcriptional regulator [Fulvivirgaceae bacterium BMA10]|uniref:BlaI/MecI/CopY family transcriptional regulator n=1 Tax=Splendidivirga corallicola TaxID=3051826 RepID=A0ABT8KLZ7_9BACT|nr:BlaI/MecI/CopY family transcriptional regulator [Fulvivirgaceae bacterium BMA10]